MSSFLRKVKSLPTLIKKRKSVQKLEKLRDSTPLSYKEPPSRPRNWLFLERCQRLEHLVDHVIALQGMDEENNLELGRIGYWANDFNEEYPMTYQPDNDSMVSDSLLRNQRLDSSFEEPIDHPHTILQDLSTSTTTLNRCTTPRTPRYSY